MPLFPYPHNIITHTKQTYLASPVTLQYKNMRIQQEKNTNIHSSKHKMHFKPAPLYQPVLIHSYTQKHVCEITLLYTQFLTLYYSTLPPTHKKICKQTLPHKQHTHRIFLWEMALKGELGNSLSHSKRHPTHRSYRP